ncbi:family 2 glycosyl transferase [Nostoc linckia z16]|nr:family 2 glycosyl transferase [Nostoc linckia z16]
MKNKLVTVITVVFNARKTLEATIESVLNQDDELVEYCIVDGGSTDGTIDLIRKYEHRLGWWCTEPDNGIYDAMNKGIDHASGKWLYFLGGDDTLRPGVIRQVAPYLKDEYSIVFGDVKYDNGYQMRSFFGPRTLLQNTIHHQSAFYKNSLFSSYRYDTSIKIVSEYDLHLRIYLDKEPVNYVPIIIADCATGGASSESARSLRETNSIRTRYLKDSWKNKFLSVFLSLYYAQKRLRYVLYGHRI